MSRDSGPHGADARQRKSTELLANYYQKHSFFGEGHSSSAINLDQVDSHRQPKNAMQDSEPHLEVSARY